MAAALTITGNTNDALAAIAKLERQYDSLEGKVKRLGAASKQAGDVGKGGFDSMAQGAMAFATQVVGIGGAVDLMVKGIQIAKNEWQDLIERRDKALDANKAFATSLTKLALATDTPLDQTKALMMRLSKENNVNLQDIPAILNAYQAAKGPTQTMADVEKTFAAAAKIGKFDAASMEQLGETALDITKQIPEIDGRRTTPEEALGFSLGAQAISRVKDPAMFNKNVMPAVLGGQKIAGTPLEVGVAMSNALTHGSGDATGRRSATAQISLEMQMKEAFPELKNAAERIRLMQENPDIREGFLQGLKNEIIGPGGEKLSLEGYHGERRMQPAIQALLTKGSAEANIYEETLRSTPKLSDASKVFEERASAMRKDPNLQVAEQDRSFQNEAERKRIADTASAKQAAARKGFEANLAAEGVGWTDRAVFGWNKFRRQVGGQTEQEAGLSELRRSIELTEKLGTSGTPEETQEYLRKLRSVEQTMSFGRAPQSGDIEYKPWDPEKTKPLRPPAVPAAPKDEFNSLSPEQLRGKGYEAERSRMEARQTGDKEEMDKQNQILTRIESVMRERTISRNGQVES